MTEHEMLKEICDKMWYESNYYDNKREIYKEWTWDDEYRLIDVREIIFTTKFMDKFEAENHRLSWTYWKKAMFQNLDNPVKFL